MMLSYIAQLKRMAEAQRAQRSQPSSLRDRFTSWYRSLPAVSRDRRFSMSEFEAALKTPGKNISPVLLELGWRRKRIWSTTGQYHRYWEPPPTCGLEHAPKSANRDAHHFIARFHRKRGRHRDTEAGSVEHTRHIDALTCRGAPKRSECGSDLAVAYSPTCFAGHLLNHQGLPIKVRAPRV